MRGTVLPLVLLCLLAARPAAHAADSPPLQVQRFEVQGNTLLPAERIQARLAPFQGSSSVARLREAAAALQALYREAGYGGVVAFVPEQTLSGGVVQLRVVEGQLSAVAKICNEELSDGSRGVSNVTEWAKRIECWDRIRARASEADAVMSN